MADDVTRTDVVDFLLKSRLLETCCECQTAKKPTEKSNLDDLIQDMWLWVMEYDEEKLVDAYKKNHLNALITRTITNNIWSRNSRHWSKYHKYNERETEITEQMKEKIADED